MIEFAFSSKEQQEHEAFLLGLRPSKLSKSSSFVTHPGKCSNICVICRQVAISNPSCDAKFGRSDLGCIDAEFCKLVSLSLIFQLFFFEFYKLGTLFHRFKFEICSWMFLYYLANARWMFRTFAKFAYFRISLIYHQNILFSSKCLRNSASIARNPTWLPEVSVYCRNFHEMPSKVEICCQKWNENE